MKEKIIFHKLTKNLYKFFFFNNEVFRLIDFKKYFIVIAILEAFDILLYF